jgi:Glycosyltransferase family 87
LTKSIGADITYTTLLVSATYAVPMCLLLGQDSMLLLLLVCSSFYLLRKDLDLLAAFVLAIALFKPQLPVILALAIMASGRAKFFVSFVAFGSALSVASMAFVGRNGIIQLVHAQRIAEGIGVSQMPTLRGLIAFAAGDHRWLSIAILAVTILAMWPRWRKSRSLEFAFASAVCVASALPLYIYSYDLVVLAIPLAVTTKNWKKSDTPVIAALTSGPLSQIVYFLHAAWLLLFPTLALGWMITVREASVMGGSNAGEGGGGRPVILRIDNGYYSEPT